MDISQHPKPPKKPLTPYMRYSKSIWPTVKAMNTTMSVCEIGATIGRMWRELNDEEKQKYNEEFVQAKADYEVEIQAYLKMTGLTASDLNKSKKSKKASNSNQQKQNNTAAAAAATASGTGMMGAMGNQHGMGLGTMAAPPGYPGAAGTTALMQASQFTSAAGALPHFQQIWTTQQYQQAMLLAAQHQQQASGNTGDGNTTAAMAMFYAQQQAAAAASANNQQQPDQQGTTQQVSPIYNGTQGQQANTGTTQQSTSQMEGQAQNAQQGQNAQQAGTASTWNWHQGTPGVSNSAAGNTQSQQQQQQQQQQAFAAQQQLLQQAQQAAQTQATTTTEQQLGPNAFPEAQRVGASPINGDVATSAATSPGLSPQNSVTENKSPASTAPSSISSAHNTYNSYQHFGWGTNQTGSASNGSGGDNGMDGKVFPKDSMLETELQHLRAALSEKTKEVQKLTQDLEKAHHTIEALKQEQGAPALQ